MASKFALIMANTKYQDESFAKLTSPGRDAEEFAEVLRELAGFEVQVLLNDAESNVSRAIEHFFSDRTSKDLLLLYFSGHGIRNDQGKLYLAASDTKKNFLRSTGISADFISELMNNSLSKRQILILDCCNSGAFAYGGKSVFTVGESMGTASAFEGHGYGRIVLTATDATHHYYNNLK